MGCGTGALWDLVDYFLSLPLLSVSGTQVTIMQDCAISGVYEHRTFVPHAGNKGMDK